MALLALVAFVSAITFNRSLFPRFTGDDDDAVYVLQAETLRDGHLTLSTADHEPFFRPWLTGVRGDRIVFPFQHGWPAALAASELVFGSMRMMLGLTAAALAIMCWLLAREFLEDRAAALLAAAFIAASPFVVVQSATFLNYLFTLLLDVTFGVLVLQGLRTRSPLRAAGAGFVLGLVLLTRPYDAVLVAIPFVLYAVYRLREEPRQLARLAGLALAGLAGPVAMLLVLNHHLTGGALTFPEAVNGGIQEFGFGTRRLAEGTGVVDYSFDRALDSLVTSVRAVPQWLFGSVVALALAAWTLVRGRLGAKGWLLLGLALTFPLGYVFWWGSLLAVEARHALGPHYYLPVVIPVAILAADALVDIWRRRRGAAVALGTGMAALTVAWIPSISTESHFFPDAFTRGDAVINDARLANAVVFLPPVPDERPYVLHPLPYLGNTPDLTGPVLYATERGAENFDLLERYPDRQPYRFRFSAPEGSDIFHPEPILVRLSTTKAPQVRVTLTLRNPNRDTPLATVYLGVDGEVAQTATLDDHSASGSEYDVTWVLSPDRAQLLTAAGEVGPAALPSSATLAFGVGFGKTSALDGTRYELRVPYEGTGDVELLVPGEQWHRVTFTESVWLRVHGRDVLAGLVTEPVP